MVKLSNDEIKFLEDLNKMGTMVLGTESNYWASKPYSKEKLKRLASLDLLIVENNMIKPVKNE